MRNDCPLRPNTFVLVGAICAVIRLCQSQTREQERERRERGGAGSLTAASSEVRGLTRKDAIDGTWETRLDTLTFN